VIGRFLEHSRLFYFRNASDDPIDGEFYIGSADWMDRNLRRRVEAVTPIEDRPLRERCWQILQVMAGDQRQAWDLQPDGSYVQRRPTDPAQQLGAHAQLMRLAQRQWRLETPGAPGSSASSPASDIPCRTWSTPRRQRSRKRTAALGASHDRP
jgi:polyphosphate kinase